MDSIWVRAIIIGGIIVGSNAVVSRIAARMGWFKTMEYTATIAACAVLGFLAAMLFPRG